LRRTGRTGSGEGQATNDDSRAIIVILKNRFSSILTRHDVVKFQDIQYGHCGPPSLMAQTPLCHFLSPDPLPPLGGSHKLPVPQSRLICCTTSPRSSRSKATFTCLERDAAGRMGVSHKFVTVPWSCGKRRIGVSIGGERPNESPSRFLHLWRELSRAEVKRARRFRHRTRLSCGSRWEPG
jgi:hypothetical protein